MEESGAGPSCQFPGNFETFDKHSVSITVTQLVVDPGLSSSSLPLKLGLNVSELGNAKLMRVKGMHNKTVRITPELKSTE